MESVEFTSELPVSAREAFAWHSRAGAFTRLMPPWEHSTLTAIAAGEGGQSFAPGARWTIRTKVLGPIAMDYVAELHSFVNGVQYEDRELHGPFAQWNHCHRFTAKGDVCDLQDHVEYRLPLMPFSWPMKPMIRRRLRDMFAYRHRLTMEDLNRHREFQHQPRLHIAVTGSRGLIGSELVPFLTSGGHRVTRLVSGKLTQPSYDDGTTWTEWNPREPLPSGMLKDVDALIHLAGDNIAEGRWTESRKKELRESRTVPTRHLADAVARDGVPTFLSGSAVGYYGHRGDEVLDEKASSGNGFLAELCREWEAAAATSARVVTLRTGVVLSPKAGALAKQLLPFKLGGGAVLGDGKQLVPWIDIQDMVYAIHHVLMTPTIVGPVNLVAPEALRNREFGRALAHVLHRPYLLTAPAFALRLMFGELANEALLGSMHAVPGALAATGYRFFQPRLEGALRLMLNRRD